MSRRIEEEQRKCASLEKQLSASQQEGAKWKNMCKAMEEKLTAEDEKEEEQAMDEEEEEEIVEVVKPASKEKGSAKKPDSSQPLPEVLTVSAPRREKKDSAITKGRKMPKSIKQDPPSRGKANSSKEKITAKKQKLRQ